MREEHKIEAGVSIECRNCNMRTTIPALKVEPGVKAMRRIFAVFVLVVFLLPVVVYAHPGNTDGSGGHYDYSTGEYHYHHGYEAHDHWDMDGDGDVDCPYLFDDKTGQNSGGGSSGSSYAGGRKIGYNDGYDDGHLDGYASGYVAGYEQAEEDLKNQHLEKLRNARKNAFFVTLALTLLFGIPLVMAFSFLSREKERQKYQNEIRLLNQEILEICGIPESLAAENKLKDNTSTKIQTPQSSFISSMEYESGKLYVSFTSGARYVYYNVPESIAKEISDAPSFGRFYHQKIKNVYPYWEVK